MSSQKQRRGTDRHKSSKHESTVWSDWSQWEWDPTSDSWYHYRMRMNKGGEPEYDYQHAKPSGKGTAVENEVYSHNLSPQGYIPIATRTTIEEPSYGYFEHAQEHGGKYQSTTAKETKGAPKYGDGQYGQTHYPGEYGVIPSRGVLNGYDGDRIGGDDPGYQCPCASGGVCTQSGGCADPLIGGDE